MTRSIGEVTSVRRRLKKALIWWIVVYVLCVIPTLGDTLRLVRLRNSGEGTSGRVRRMAEHNSIEYVFQYAGRSYNGISRTGLAGIPDYHQLRGGDVVAVYYLPGNPRVNAAGVPAALVSDALSMYRFLALFAAIGTGFIFAMNILFPRRHFLGYSMEKVNRFLFG